MSPRGLIGACVAVASLATLAGCGSDEGDAAVRGSPASIAAPARAHARAGGVRLVRVAGGLGDALGVVSDPGRASRLLVVQQSGTVRVVERGRVLPRPFLDISRLVTSGGERGLLGLALHPGYALNGRFVVNYTDRAGNTQVVEYRRASATRASARGARRLLSIAQPYANHNGGQLQFGPDGLLHVGTGDGGGGGDPEGNVQNTGSLLGKILRIDVDRRDGGRPYGIPPDNPFASGGGRPEVYSYGLRNPWRFSFDRARGDLWIADVGQGEHEEVNVRPRGAGRGANFGWNAFEGRAVFAGPGVLRGPGRPVAPVAVYGHDRGCSVTGGYVYRGARAPALRGRYLFADYCSGRVWSMRTGPRPGPAVELTGRLGTRLTNVTSFGEGADGDLYIIGNGALYRFEHR